MSIKEYLEKQKALKDTLIKGVATAATVGMLVTGGLTACDKTPDDPIVDDTKNPSVSDTIETPSESTPVETEPNETTTPEDTTKEPEETLSPELLEKYPPISDEDYQKFMEYAISKDSSLKDGIATILVNASATENKLLIEFLAPLQEYSKFKFTTDKKELENFKALLGDSLVFVQNDFAYIDLSDENLSEKCKQSLFTLLMNINPNFQHSLE